MARVKVLPFRMTDREYSKLKRHADRMGIPMAEVLREFVNRLPDKGEEAQKDGT
jgi:hypothetical protein